MVPILLSRPSQQVPSGVMEDPERCMFSRTRQASLTSPIIDGMGQGTKIFACVCVCAGGGGRSNQMVQLRSQVFPLRTLTLPNSPTCLDWVYLTLQFCYSTKYWAWSSLSPPFHGRGRELLCMRPKRSPGATCGFPLPGTYPPLFVILLLASMALSKNPISLLCATISSLSLKC